MKTTKTLTRFILFFIISASLVACGGRVPSPKTAQSTSLSYFKRYGRKFTDTPFAHKNVESVTINSIEEISLNYAFVDTVVTFLDGHAARALVRMNKRFPGGWKVISWEMLAYK